MDIAEQAKHTLLFAYIDGELDTDQRQMVQRLLAHDADMRQRVAQFRELNMLVKAAYGEKGCTFS